MKLKKKKLSITLNIKAEQIYLPGKFSKILASIQNSWKALRAFNSNFLLGSIKKLNKGNLFRKSSHPILGLNRAWHKAWMNKWINSFDDRVAGSNLA